MNSDAHRNHARKHPPIWIASVLAVGALGGLWATISGALKWGPAVTAFFVVAIYFIDRRELTRGFAVAVVAALAAAVWFGASQREVELQRIAYEAYRAQIGCENSDKYTSSAGLRHAGAKLPTPADLRRCGSHGGPAPWDEYRMELEGRGWGRAE